jgi:hypothetical protein
MNVMSRSARSSGRRLFGVAVVVPLLLTACGDSDDLALCPSYAQFELARDVLRTVDAESETAAEAIREIEAFQSSVRQLRENTDGRYRSSVDDLDVAISDVLRTLESVDADEEYSTWAPLVAEDVETAQNASARVSELIAPQCAPYEGN